MAKQDTSKSSGAVGIAHRILSVGRAEIMSGAVAQKATWRGKAREGGVQEKVKVPCGTRWCVEYLVQTALLALTFPNNQRRCPEHEANSKHHKIDDDK